MLSLHNLLCTFMLFYKKKYQLVGFDKIVFLASPPSVTQFCLSHKNQFLVFFLAFWLFDIEQWVWLIACGVLLEMCYFSWIPQTGERSKE